MQKKKTTDNLKYIKGKIQFKVYTEIRNINKGQKTFHI